MADSAIWDGFDDWDQTTSPNPWDAGSTFSISSAYARFPAAPNCVSKGMRIGSNNYLQKNYTSNVASPIASFAVYFESFSTGAFIQFLDTGTGQIGLVVSAAGALQVWRPGLGTMLATTGPGVITTGVWYFIDFIATISSTVGSF